MPPLFEPPGAAGLIPPMVRIHKAIIPQIKFFVQTRLPDVALYLRSSMETYTIP
jgi:hypothetical protein